MANIENTGMAAEIQHLKDENARLADDLNGICLEASFLDEENDRFKKQVSALKEIWKVAVPNKISDIDTLKQMYTIAEKYDSVDEDGYRLYNAAVGILHTTVERLYPYEDARGYFENASYRTSLDMLIAAEFGKVSWKIVPGTSYEKACIEEYSLDTPEYQAFEREMYARALVHMGYGEFVE